VLSNFSVLANY